MTDTRTFEDFVLECIQRFGGEVRENQLEMIRHVVSAIEQNKPLVIECPTGSGKSFGTLIPAIFVAKTANKRVLYVTQTKKLQDQLSRDMPRFIEAVLGSEDAFTWSVLKGRNHFTCRKRITSSSAQIPVSLIPWVHTGGSRNDAPPHEDKDWWQVSGGQDCTGKKCPFYIDCPGTVQRKQAERAQIVIANQSLLAMNIAFGERAIPGEFDIVIVDEAQHFEDSLRSQLANDLKPQDLENATFADAADIVRAMMVPEGFEFHPGIKKGEALYQAYAASVVEMKKLDFELKDNENPDLEDKKMLNLLKKIVRTLSAFSKPDENILWFDKDGMHSSPIDVKDLIRDYLGDKASIFTSATIPDDLGLGREIVKISGGYTNCGLYISPEHDGSGTYVRRFGALQEMRELIEALGGRTLVILTSSLAMEDTYNYLRSLLNVPVYHQNQSNAIERFREEETSVLVGMDTVREGVDIPGSSLSCVIIDRIPFPNLGDPVVQSNNERLGWHKGSLQPAITAFRQSVGRLLRDKSDFGVVCVLDNRLRTKGYAGQFLKHISAQSIPDKETAIKYLKQIREEAENK